MKKALTVSLAGILVVLVLCSLNYAQEVGKAKRPNEEDAALPASTWEESIGFYEYVISSVLAEEQEEYVGKYVKIVDDLAVFWDDPTPHDTKEEVDEMRAKGYKGDYDNQTLVENYGYLKFETLYFSCLLPEEYDESVQYLRWLNQRKTFDDVNQIVPERKLVCIYGKLIRTTVWGKVGEPGASQGTQPEEVVLMVHKIERPAERFFKEGPNEEE
jgi:hypothetical protein